MKKQITAVLTCMLLASTINPAIAATELEIINTEPTVKLERTLLDRYISAPPIVREGEVPKSQFDKYLYYEEVYQNMVWSGTLTLSSYTYDAINNRTIVLYSGYVFVTV